MFTESRTQGAVAVILGAVAALSPLWVTVNDDARLSLIVLGVLVALTGLAHLANRAGIYADYAMALFGVLMIVSPWVMSFDSLTGAAWTAWVVGALTTVVALTALPQVSGRLHTATHH